jgi:hypothetical protein
MINQPQNEDLELSLAKHMLSFRLDYFQFFEDMYQRLHDAKDKTESYGDLDFHFELIHDKPQKPDDEMQKYLRVFLVHNSCTCSDKNQWIVVITGDRLGRQLHVRVIYDKSDYPRKDYPDKLSLKFYKDRDFVMKYVEKHHMTKLGSVYGDIRDRGYVISYEQSLGNFAKLDKHNETNDQYHLYSFYKDWRNFTDMMHFADCELQQEKKK